MLTLPENTEKETEHSPSRPKKGISAARTCLNLALSYSISCLERKDFELTVGDISLYSAFESFLKSNDHNQALYVLHFCHAVRNTTLCAIALDWKWEKLTYRLSHWPLRPMER